jgi:hypothetical protein
MNDDTFDRIFIDIARQDLVAGNDTDDIDLRSTGMTNFDRAALACAVAEILNDILNDDIGLSQADRNWRRQGEIVKACDDLLNATWHARRAAAALRAAAEMS